MQFIFTSFLFFSLVIYASAQYQLDPSEYYVDNHFRTGSPSSSFDVAQVDERFIKTVSLTLTTTTVTSTTTLVATCTTSTGGLSICTASGRRRRGLHLGGNKEGRGLFYNENEEVSDQGTIFLPSPAKEEPVEKQVQPEAAPAPEENDAAKFVPFVVQPGFTAPSGKGRVLLFFGTSTTTTTTTTTSTTSLTATCRSTTGYQLCNSQGK